MQSVFPTIHNHSEGGVYEIFKVSSFYFTKFRKLCLKTSLTFLIFHTKLKLMPEKKTKSVSRFPRNTRIILTCVNNFQ